MAHTAHQTQEEILERFDEPDVLEEKAAQIAEWIANARHCVFFTGAGISTSAGIPDFRGPDGVWTLRAQNKTRTKPTTSTLSAIPTKTHMAIKTLLEVSKVKHLISQNTDGLHRRSGVDVGQLSELHGNSNLERCAECHKEYLRDYRCRTARRVHSHETGRRCTVPGCNGKLQDSIINFGENLPDRALQDGFYHGKHADLMICLGSSLTVTPAADMPRETAQRGGRLVVCNLQITPLDGLSALRVFARCDDLMERVMWHLALAILPFILRRRVRLARDRAGQVLVEGVDRDGSHFSLFQSCALTTPGAAPCRAVNREPFAFPLPTGAAAADLELVWMGHYSEPPTALDRLPLPPPGGAAVHDLEYDPRTRRWACPGLPEGAALRTPDDALSDQIARLAIGTAASAPRRTASRSPPPCANRSPPRATGAGRSPPRAGP
eukprot:gnl/Trimastix_PCT/3054.p1 GENE.gnl/Trimastix_PCT/3054~~gnl/Trimastix_PCT/3054.p1  ORF type:complete len:437 (-),score=68.47 gnl/Trimastix_PCT/3054:66-1376(-)